MAAAFVVLLETERARRRERVFSFNNKIFVLFFSVIVFSFFILIRFCVSVLCESKTTSQSSFWV